MRQSILVVDDEKNIRLTMTHCLEPLDMDVETASDGNEALDKLSQGRFGIVFLDLKMPGLDGMEVLRRIADRWPKTRVIIITAHGSIESAVEAMKLGAMDFIQKPFTPAEIRDLVARVIEREALEEETTTAYGELIELAKRYISDRNFEKANDIVRKAIASDPAKPEAYNLCGVLLEIKGDWLEGQKFYRAALDIDPTYKPARANLERTTSWRKTGAIELGPDLGTESGAKRSNP